jgi:hypothetical protein
MRVFLPRKGLTVFSIFCTLDVLKEYVYCDVTEMTSCEKNKKIQQKKSSVRAFSQRESIVKRNKVRDWAYLIRAYFLNNFI